MTKPHNILIVRLSAIGDIVMASPLLGAFRRSMPESSLSWLVEETSKSVLEANPNLHEIIVLPRNRWRELIRKRRYWTLARECFVFTKDLRKRGFDLVVDAQGLLKSGLWSYLTGAPERVGIGSKEGSQHLMTRVVNRSGASDRISSQYLLLAEAMGLEVGDFRMELPLSENAMEYGHRFASALGTPYAVLCPFTTRPQKHWIQKRWPKVAHHLFCELGLNAVILGGWGDVEAADRMAENASGIINLAGKTTLQEAGAVIARSSLLIGVDTGLTHMGFALSVPTVALFGATRPYLDTGGMPGTVLYHPRACSPCRRSPTCDGLFSCMDAISVDEVLQTARALSGIR